MNTDSVNLDTTFFLFILIGFFRMSLIYFLIPRTTIIQSSLHVINSRQHMYLMFAIIICSRCNHRCGIGYAGALSKHKVE